MPRLCSPRCSPPPPLHPTSMPSSAQATLLSRSTVLKRRFYLRAATVKNPRSHPTPYAVSTKSASSMAVINGHHPPLVSPPRGPPQRPDPLWPASRRWQPRVRTTAVVPLRPTRATVDSTPSELPSSRPCPNRFTKPSWRSSHRSPASLIAGEPELAEHRHPASSARLLCSGWASCRNGRPTRWARSSHQQKRPKCTMHSYLFQSICLNQIKIVQTS
jgi:hypothetical protein